MLAWLRLVGDAWLVRTHPRAPHSPAALPYGVIVPDGCADATFVGETTMPFVSYLNWVFSHGGFAVAVAVDPDPTWWRIRAALAKDLLPL